MPENCRHLPVSCHVNAAKGFVHAFKLAFLIKYATTKIPAILAKLMATRRLDGLPKLLLSDLSDHLRFSLALALINSSYKAILCLGRTFCEKYNLSQDKLPFIAGFLSGLFLKIIKGHELRRFLAYQMVGRVVDVACNWWLQDANQRNPDEAPKKDDCKEKLVLYVAIWVVTNIATIMFANHAPEFVDRITVSTFMKFGQWSKPDKQLSTVWNLESGYLLDEVDYLS